jgi:hypothetical protein
MRALEFKFHPEQVKISAEEILADLNYPVRISARRNGSKPAPRPKIRA